MSRPFVTASAIERVVECPASAVLPQTQSTSIWATSGKNVHSDIEDIVSGRKETTSAGLTKSHLALPDEALPEVAFSYDVVTGEAKELGYVGSREYPPVSFSTIVGTADVVGVGAFAVGDTGTARQHISVDIVDWKTNYEPPPPDSWQMRVLAFMAARARGRSCARTRITHIRGGISHSHWKIWLEPDFEETEKILRKTYDSVNKLGWKKDKIALGDVRHGPHCHWCPAYLSCPYPRALLRNNVDTESSALLTNFDAANAYSKWQAIRTLSGRLEDALKAYASQKPIDLGNGNLWGRPTQSSGYRKFKMYAAMEDE